MVADYLPSTPTRYAPLCVCITDRQRNEILTEHDEIARQRDEAIAERDNLRGTLDTLTEPEMFSTVERLQADLEAERGKVILLTEQRDRLQARVRELEHLAPAEQLIEATISRLSYDLDAANARADKWQSVAERTSADLARVEAERDEWGRRAAKAETRVRELETQLDAVKSSGQTAFGRAIQLQAERERLAQRVDILADQSQRRVELYERTVAARNKETARADAAEARVRELEQQITDLRERHSEEWDRDEVVAELRSRVRELEKDAAGLAAYQCASPIPSEGGGWQCAKDARADALAAKLAELRERVAFNVNRLRAKFMAAIQEATDRAKPQLLADIEAKNREQTLPTKPQPCLSRGGYSREQWEEIDAHERAQGAQDMGPQPLPAERQLAVFAQQVIDKLNASSQPCLSCGGSGGIVIDWSRPIEQTPCPSCHGTGKA